MSHYDEDPLTAMPRIVLKSVQRLKPKNIFLIHISSDYVIYRCIKPSDHVQTNSTYLIIITVKAGYLRVEN